MAVGGIEGWNNDYCLNPIPDGYEISFHDAGETFREIYYSNDTAVLCQDLVQDKMALRAY